MDFKRVSEVFQIGAEGFKWLFGDFRGLRRLSDELYGDLVELYGV